MLFEFAFCITKSLALASALFPNEQWIPTEANIWVAKSRLVEQYREPEKWEREMSQVRILTDRGSVKAKIAGELKGRQDTGQFICYFEHLGELRIWSYDELKGMMGGGEKKSPGSA